jgi:nicotinamidase-related amidase
MDPLLAQSSVLIVVDIQEKLAPAMEAGALERVLANTVILLEMARLFSMPVLASEQYPKGLGLTVAPVRAKLDELGVKPIAKMDFDACGEPAFARALSSLAPRAAIVVGIEAHVCVFQTARELVRRGIATYVVADAVASRRGENRTAGLSLCERAGAVVTVTEAVAFDVVRHAGTDTFKAISKLVR